MRNENQKMRFLFEFTAKKYLVKCTCQMESSMSTKSYRYSPVFNNWGGGEINGGLGNHEKSMIGVGGWVGVG